MKNPALHRYIDHSVLKPELSRAEAKAAIQSGIDYNVFTVCVRPCDIELALAMCKGTTTDVSVVLAFPHGVATATGKASEACDFIAKGVKEIDMVVNYGFIRSAEWAWVEKDIRSVSELTKPAGVLLKVILETSALKLVEIAKATEIAINANADYVKTSTGFASGGATEDAVKAMLDAARGRIKVKASGGIRDYQQALRFVEMGVQRLGIGYSTTPIICGQREQTAKTTETY